MADPATPPPETLTVQGLEVSGLRARYGRREIVRGIDLPVIEIGRMTAIIGPNGAGKSTVLKALAQVLPSEGRLYFNGRDLRRMTRHERASCVGFMPQSLPRGTELTAIECVVLGLQASGQESRLEDIAISVFRRLDIAKLALAQIDRLSGGERQLVSLAQALAPCPRILFLDEPTSSLDLARTHQVMGLLRAAARDGAAVVTVLHDLALAAQWAERIIVIRDGRLYGVGSPAELITASMLLDVYGLKARVKQFGDHLVIAPEKAATELTLSTPDPPGALP